MKRISVIFSLLGLFLSASPIYAHEVELVDASGSTSSASAQNVSSVSISGLSATDVLECYVMAETVSSANASVYLYSSTDSVNLTRTGLWPGNTTTRLAHIIISAKGSSSSEIVSLTDTGASTLANESFTQNLSTAWTGSWTLALRHDGTGGSGSLYWSWKCYVVGISSGSSLPADASGYLKNDGSGNLSWDSSSTVKSFLSLGNVENTALSTWAGTSNITTLGTIGAGTWQATTLGVGYGGTGQTTYTDGQLLIGNTTGNTLTKATLTDGSNITVTNGSGSITIASSGGGGSLPTDADGFLNNDGSGNLSWQTPSLSWSMYCGNGTRNEGEQCDDGNVFDQDGCTNACQIEAGYTCDQAEPSVCSAVGSTEWSIEGSGTDLPTVFVGFLAFVVPLLIFAFVGFSKRK